MVLVRLLLVRWLELALLLVLVHPKMQCLVAPITLRTNCMNRASMPTSCQRAMLQVTRTLTGLQQSLMM